MLNRQKDERENKVTSRASKDRCITVRYNSKQRTQNKRVTDRIKET